MNHHHTSNSVVSATRKRKDREDSGDFDSKNRILAGYMAHEFLTMGTLFGQKFDPARAVAIPVSVAEHKRKPVPVHSGVGCEPGATKASDRRYAEVAQILKGDSGAHIPGIVNPTQLGRWIQM